MRTAVAIGLLLAAVLPASAQAKVFAGSATDPAGDVAPATRDIVAVSARYDDGAGTIEATVQLAAPAGAADGAVAVAFSAGACGTGPAAAMADALAPGVATPQWAFDGSEGAATRSGTPPSVTLTVTAFGPLAYEGFTCVRARTSPDGTATSDTADVALADTTPPPAPTPTPTPAPAPAPDPAPLGPSPLTRGEKLEAALAACAGAKPCVRKARKRHRPSRGERFRAALEACGGKARCERKVRRRFRGVKPAPKPTGVERRLYANSESDILGACGGVCWEAVAFVNRRFAYVGLPEGAALPNCRSVTYDAEDEEGCATYSVKRGTVRVAGRSYAIAKGGLRRAPEGDEKEATVLERQVFPKAGSRWDVPEIEAIYISGSPFVGTQIVTRTYLTLTKDGRFVKSSEFFGSSAPGTNPGLIVAGSRPDTRGTYAIAPGGFIRLTYDDGKVESGTTFFWDAAKGRDPNLAGLHVIDDTFFGPPGDYGVNLTVMTSPSAIT